MFAIEEPPGSVPSLPVGPGLVGALDAAHARVCSDQRDLLALIAEVDVHDLWRDDGARDTAHWLAMRYGISEWKSRRWIAAAHALADLPALDRALSGGTLGIDKVVELARFATPDTEERLIRWAGGVSCGAIRRRGDLLARADAAQVVEAERTRSISWWYPEDGARFGLELECPAAQGPVIVRALEREAEALPAMPDGDAADHPMRARMADAFVALCSSRLARDPDPDRATVVVHAQLDGLLEGSGGCELEDGPVIHPEIARRLLCNARIQGVVEDADGNVLGVGRMRREPPPWLVRQVRHRDRECRFPGCGSRRFTEAHHIVFWRNGGTTDLDNLVLICSFHHRLVHELGWSLAREAGGALTWFRPGGVPYRPGPSSRAGPSPRGPTG